MAAPKSFRVKRSKSNLPLVFNVEVELYDGEDESEVKTPGQMTPDEQAEAAAAEREAKDATTPKEFVVAYPEGPRTYPFSERVRDDDGEVLRHWFRARPKIAGASILDLVGAGVHSNGGYAAAATRDFMIKVIDKRDRERFDDLLVNSDPPISMDDFNPIIEWLMEQYTERPTT